MKNPQTGLILRITLVIIAIMVIGFVVYKGLNFFGAFQNYGQDIGPAKLTQLTDFAQGSLIESLTYDDKATFMPYIDNLNLNIMTNGQAIPLKQLVGIVGINTWGSNKTISYATIVTEKDDLKQSVLYAMNSNLLTPVLFNGMPFSGSESVFGDTLGDWYAVGTFGDTPNLTIFKITGNIATEVQGIKTVPQSNGDDFIGLEFDATGQWYAGVHNQAINKYMVGYKINGDTATYLSNVNSPSGIHYYIDSDNNWYFLQVVGFAPGPNVSYLYRINGDEIQQIKKSDLTFCDYSWVEPEFPLSCFSAN